MVRSLRSASSRAVPILMTGMRVSVYSSALRLTKSSSKPMTLAVAVSRCLDWSGLLLITPIEPIFSLRPVASKWLRRWSAKSLPIWSSIAMSMSEEGRPMILSRTHPPATLSTQPSLRCRTTSISSAKSADSSGVREIESPGTAADSGMVLARLYGPGISPPSIQTPPPRCSLRGKPTKPRDLGFSDPPLGLWANITSGSATFLPTVRDGGVPGLHARLHAAAPPEPRRPRAAALALAQQHSPALRKEGAYVVEDSGGLRQAVRSADGDRGGQGLRAPEGGRGAELQAPSVPQEVPPLPRLRHLPLRLSLRTPQPPQVRHRHRPRTALPPRQRLPHPPLPLLHPSVPLLLHRHDPLPPPLHHGPRHQACLLPLPRGLRLAGPRPYLRRLRHPAPQRRLQCCRLHPRRPHAPRPEALPRLLGDGGWEGGGNVRRGRAGGTAGR
mmetsp:Transcript_29942/g.75341  ORF Transcript_29942/g.75341 Transcript_29942/m.75341 type:complete len:442 (+) Transcript_29942:517-1842(+)